MPLQRGTRVGPYEITSSLGAGGMGEVYRARDARLQRDVALKILPSVFAADPERLSRFEREAQVLASLNHPHIAAIYGFEESDGLGALVLELVEGETLHERLLRGAIPFDDALSFGKQIALALEAAHDQGIVHRDLKPANIKITPSGSVKVLDFGLAKFYAQGQTAAFATHAPSTNAESDRAARSEGSAGRDFSMSPTMASPALMTGAGMILGTAAYMSPEQARGKPVDRRTDIWAFGCVMFEMLTGARPFDAGDTVSDAVAAILKTDPDWAALPPDVPARIRTLLRRCLQKDPEKRLPHIGLVRIEIEESGATDPAADRAEAPVTSWRGSAAWAGAFILALVAGIVLWAPWRNVRPAPELRVDVAVPDGVDPFSIALSPDGRQVAFVASDQGDYKLWIRSLTTGEARVVSGTDGAAYPFWSPDSRSIAFFANTRLMRWDVGGNSATALTSTIAVGRGGTWGADGVIVYAAGGTTGLFRIPSTGGEPTPITTLAKNQVSHRFPQFLPDGRRFLFYAQGTPDPHWSGDGRSVLFRGGPDRDFFRRSLGVGGADNDLLVLKASATQAPNDWSPDGRSFLYIVVAPKTQSDIWLATIDGEAKPEPFLNSQFTERNAQFSPDGTFVAYQSDESGRFEIYVRPFPKAGGQSTVSVNGGVAPRWRADGKEIFYVGPDGTIHAVPVLITDGTIAIGKPMPLFRPRILFGGASPIGIQWQYDVAPDGRLLVNVETDDGADEALRLILNWTPN